MQHLFAALHRRTMLQRIPDFQKAVRIAGAEVCLDRGMIFGFEQLSILFQLQIAITPIFYFISFHLSIHRQLVARQKATLEKTIFIQSLFVRT